MLDDVGAAAGFRPSYLAEESPPTIGSQLREQYPETDGNRSETARLLDYGMMPCEADGDISEITS